MQAYLYAADHLECPEPLPLALDVVRGRHRPHRPHLPEVPVGPGREDLALLAGAVGGAAGAGVRSERPEPTERFTGSWKELGFLLKCM